MIPITTAEAADLLGCSEKTVIRAIAARKLEVIRRLPGPNGTHLLDPADVLRFRTQREQRRAS